MGLKPLKQMRIPFNQLSNSAAKKKREDLERQAQAVAAGENPTKLRATLTRQFRNKERYMKKKQRFNKKFRKIAPIDEKIKYVPGLLTIQGKGSN